ncbi:MAG: PAC2 family protein [Candidatus Bathyarchaeia archaeon]
MRCAIRYPLASEGLYNISSALLDWAEERKAKELVVLEGIPVRGIPKKRESLCAAQPEKRKECEARGVKMLSGHVLIHGIAGSVLGQCLTRKISGVAFLTPAAVFMPDPEGAATLLSTLDDTYGVKMDTGKLLKSAKEIRQKLQEVAHSYQRMRNAETRRGTPPVRRRSHTREQLGERSAGDTGCPMDG